MRRLYFTLLFFVLILASQPLFAVTYYVTHSPTFLCSSSKSGYSIFVTIQEAVNQVPPGSIINVCPGTYPEQVVISQPVTLRGVSYGNQSQAVIAMPSTGLATTSSFYWGSVSALVQVTAGPVNITNITIDGTAEPDCPINWFFGILYSSGSSGTVNQVETRNQTCTPQSIGIGAENQDGPTESVTIENSNTTANTGIYACSWGSPSSLTVSIKGNYIAGPEFGENGVSLPCPGVAGSISGNVIVEPTATGISTSSLATVSGNTVIGPANGIGISVNAGPEVSGNTIQGAALGVYLNSGGATVTSNRIFNSVTYGIYANSAGSTIKSNIITEGSVGIEFNCHANTVSGNTFNNLATGLDKLPTPFTEVNTFYNVATNTTTGGC